MRSLRSEVSVKRDRDAVGVENRLVLLERALQQMGEQVDRAADALAPILGHERPSPALDPSDSAGAESSIGRNLENATALTQALSYRLHAILDRVDL